MSRLRRLCPSPVLAGLSGLLLAACSEGPIVPAPDAGLIQGPSFQTLGPPQVVTLCKIGEAGTWGDFSIEKSVEGPEGGTLLLGSLVRLDAIDDSSIPDGCVEIWRAQTPRGDDPTVELTVTEVDASPGTQLVSIHTDSQDGQTHDTDPTGSVTLRVSHDHGGFIKVTNEGGEPPPGPEPVLGRMTGGGSVFIGPDSDIRVTHGFQLRCSAEDPRQNLQINWHPPRSAAHRWHLEELTLAECWMDPEFSPLPREAPINTFRGRGVGRYNGQPGATAEWIFTDEGEPGVDDRIVSLVIRNAAGTVVLEVDNEHLTFGNHQAHPASGGGPTT